MLLVRDEDYRQKLKSLAGASLAFKITDMHFQCVVVFHHQFIEVLPEYAEPDLFLWGKSVHFGQFLLAKESRQSLLQKRQIDFCGDLMLLEKVEAFIPSLKYVNFSFFKQ